MRRLAIIPARGGSKRIPNKNIREFCGRPIISYSLNVAAESRLFDKIHVSSDDDQIIELVSGLGFSPEFRRPAELSTDFVPLVPVMQFVVDALEQQGEFFDQITLIMPCAPFLLVDDLLGCDRLFQSKNGKSCVVTVSEYPVPIEWAYDFETKTNTLIPIEPGAYKIRSQDLKPKFFDTGSIAVFSRDALRESSNIAHRFVGYVLPKTRSIDIDDQSDWIIAESIFQGLDMNKL